MAVIRAYFDDSGDPDDPTHSFLTIAGHVAELGDWKRFRRLLGPRPGRGTVSYPCPAWGRLYQLALSPSAA